MSSSPKPISDYAIGDSMYRHVEGGGTFHYVVKGVRENEDGVQLEVECQTCTHGWKCRVLVAQNDYGRIVAVHMLNEDEDDPQRHWHTNDGLHFWPTRDQAREEGLQKIIRRVKERISDAEGRLKADREFLRKLEAAINGTPEAPNEQ